MPGRLGGHGAAGRRLLALGGGAPQTLSSGGHRPSGLPNGWQGLLNGRRGPLNGPPRTTRTGWQRPAVVLFVGAHVHVRGHPAAAAAVNRLCAQGAAAHWQ